MTKKIFFQSERKDRDREEKRYRTIRLDRNSFPEQMNSLSVFTEKNGNFKYPPL